MISCLLVAPLLWAQAPPVFRVGIETVSVDVSVTSRGGPLRGLRAEDFAVRDNGVLQRVEILDHTALPTSVVAGAGQVGERLGPKALAAASGRCACARGWPTTSTS